MQDTIRKVGLESVPFFEFMVFIYFIVDSHSKSKHFISYRDKVRNTLELIRSIEDGKEISMTIKADKKKITFNNSSFIKSLLSHYDNYLLNSSSLVEVETLKLRERTVQYLIIKNLIDHLPVSVKKRSNAKYSNKERILYLCVLYYLKLLVCHDKHLEDNCSSSNNATFDKLMRDFEGYDPDIHSDLI